MQMRATTVGNPKSGFRPAILLNLGSFVDQERKWILDWNHDREEDAYARALSLVEEITVKALECLKRDDFEQERR